jgi:hypothetical protein
VGQIQEYEHDPYSRLHAIYESRNIHTSDEQDHALVLQVVLAEHDIDTWSPKQNDIQSCTW